MRVERISVNLTQDQAESVAGILMRDQHTTSRYSDEPPTTVKGYLLLTMFRHAVVEAGGQDRYLLMSHLPETSGGSLVRAKGEKW